MSALFRGKFLSPNSSYSVISLPPLSPPPHSCSYLCCFLTSHGQRRVWRLWDAGQEAGRTGKGALNPPRDAAAARSASWPSRGACAVRPGEPANCARGGSRPLPGDNTRSRVWCLSGAAGSAGARIGGSSCGLSSRSASSRTWDLSTCNGRHQKRSVGSSGSAACVGKPRPRLNTVEQATYAVQKILRFCRTIRLASDHCRGCCHPEQVHFRPA